MAFTIFCFSSVNINLATHLLFFILQKACTLLKRGIFAHNLNFKPWIDQDDDAIDKRHDIYYDEDTGTMAAVNFFKGLGGDTKVISIDGGPSIGEVTEAVMSNLK